MRIFSDISVKLFLILIFIFLAGADCRAGDPVKAQNGMVVSASALASKVGIQILEKGGNAVDAAVAVGFALAVTYPSAGNIGGGGYMVIGLENGKKTTIDFREKAPLKTHKDIYINSRGEYVPDLSLKGWTSAGVPGTVAGLIYALENYGTMTLKEVIEPAVILASEGFMVDYKLAASINKYNEEFNRYAASKKIFTSNGDTLQEGHLLIQKDLASSLRLIRDLGRDGFYKGLIPELMVKYSNQYGGYFSAEDFENYKVVEKTPVYGNYRGFEIISMGPSSSGGIALIEALNILENFTFSRSQWGSSEYIFTLAEALKYVYADRAEFLGDEEFIDIPKDKLLSKEYAYNLAKKIGEYSVGSSEIGNYALPDESRETTHYCVGDKYGNVVSTTVTINSAYGSKIVVEGTGFLLNNQMDDFSAKPGTPNQYGMVGSYANQIEPGKRMLSSMTPTLVYRNNKPYIVIGSPGGSTIITAVLQVILNCIDFGMNIKAAIDMPRIHHQWLPDRIDYERYGLTEDVKKALMARGQIIGEEVVLGRVEGILIDEKGNLWGATDPRGFGLAAGY